MKLKPVIAAKAKENLSTHTADGYQGCQNSDKAPIDTKKEIAKAAGVSHDTIAKVERIEQQATPEIKQALRTGDLSINAAYNKVKQAEKATTLPAATALNLRQPNCISTHATTCPFGLPTINSGGAT